MKKLSFICLLICLMTSSVAVYAGEIHFKRPKTETRVTGHDYHHITLINEISSLSYLNITTEKGVFTQVIADGYTSSAVPGYPMVPVVHKMIEVPFGATVSVEITASSYEDFSFSFRGIPDLIPAQLPVSKSIDKIPPFKYDSAAYALNSFLPQQSCGVEIVGISRGLRLGRLSIQPVQYNPVTRVLRIYHSMEITVHFEHPDIPLTIQERQKNNNPFFRGINQQIINAPEPADGPLDTLVQNPVKYVIVSPVSFQSVLQPFVAWKKKKGFQVVEAYTNNPLVGTTTTSIKNYLQGLYNAGTAADPAPSFILFVGDVAQIPAFSGTTGSHPTDLYYCDYTGDNLPDVYYGRFSATTEAQLTPQINKTLQYEQYLMPDPSFLDECVMIGGVDATYGPLHANGQINYGTSTYFNAAHGLTSHTYLYPASGSSDAQIRADVSAGVCYANYTAHGSSSGWADPSFTTADVPSMTNANKYPLMVGNACLTNKFNDSECFGEALLRANNKGALGYIGASNNTYWNEDYYWGVGAKTVVLNPSYSATQLGAYDRTFHDHGETYENWYMTQGQMVYAGNLAVEQGAPGSADYYWEIYHLMGDPSLMIYFSQADPITASYNSPLPIGSTSLTINTLPYAYCAVSYNGVLYGAAQANSNGTAILSLIPFSGPCTADVVITLQNHQPFSGTLIVANPNAPMCLYQNHTLNDGSGNNNGLLDFGESVQLSIGIQNVGLQPATNVNAVLSTSDAWVTLTDNSQNYGSMASGALVTPVNGFAFSVSNTVPDNHLISFTLTITAGSNTWVSNFTITAHAPVLSFQSCTVSDPTGNNDGKLDPGETANLVLSIANTGSAAATACLGNLSCPSPYLTLISNNQSFGTLAAGGAATASFSVSASPSTPAGHMASFTLAISGNNGASGNGAFSISVGQIPVLILDLDPNGNAAPAIAAAIQANNISTQTQTTIPANLNLYASVFVCLGIYSNNHALTAAEGTQLAAYLNAGGKMYVEGGDTWAYDTQTALQPLFFIDGISDGNSDLSTVNGQTGTFTAGQTFSYTGENNWIDRIQPEAGSTAFTILSNPNPVYATAIAYSGTSYKTIGASHEFAGLANAAYPNTKNELMRRYLVFFGLISNQLTANFSANQTQSCTGTSLTFSDLSTGSPTSWAWSFPGGTPATSSLQNPIVSYANPGTYSVTLVVGNGSTTHSITKTDYVVISQAPAITLQPVNATILETQNTSFNVTATNASTYQWQVSTNGGSSYTAVVNSGMYGGANTGTLSITGAAISMNNYKYRCLITGTCSPTALTNPVTLTVNPLAPIATNIQNYLGCSGSISVPVTVTNFNNVSAISMMLTLNGSALTFTGFSGVHSALSGGSLLGNQIGNTFALSWFSISPSTIGTGTLFNLNFTANAAGNFPIAFNTGSAGNCQYSDLNGNTLLATFNGGNIAVNGLTTQVAVAISSNPALPVCYGTPVQFTATGTNPGTNPDYTWMLNGVPAGNGISWAADNLNDGDQVSCVLTSSISSTCLVNNPAVSNIITTGIHALPVIDLGPDQILGAGTVLTLDAGPGFSSYLWSTGETTQTIDVNSSGTYSVYAETSAGCSATDSLTVIIGITDVQGYITYNNSVVTPMNDIQVTLNQGSTVIMTATTDANGFFEFEDAPVGTFTLIPSCSKPWGGVNATDALLILKHFVSISSLSGLPKKAADIDNTNTINSVDALATQKRYVGMITSFIAGDWAFERPIIDVNGMGVVNQNIKALCYGDVNGSYIPGLKENSAFSIASKGLLNFQPGEVLEYPVFLEEDFNPGAYSLEFELADGVRLLDISGPEHSLEPVIWYQSGKTVKVSWASLENLSLYAGERLMSLRLLSDMPQPSVLLNPAGDFASVEALSLAAPKVFSPVLIPNEETLSIYPNPFLSSTVIDFYGTERERFSIKIFSLEGQCLSTQHYTIPSSGHQYLNLNGSALPSGVYIVELQSDTRNSKVRIIKQ